MNSAQAADQSRAADASASPAPQALAGWRHGATWTDLVMLIVSAVALVVSVVLSAAVLSCSDVAESWQAEIVKFGGLSYPNAFFGIAAESVFVTIAVIGLARVRVPRWFAACTWFGGLAALAYSYWLTSQSLFVINALCPWCLALMFSTTIQFMALSHATVTVQGLPPRASAKGLRTYYRLNYDLMADAVWILAIITLILVKDGPALFA